MTHAIARMRNDFYPYRLLPYVVEDAEIKFLSLFLLFQQDVCQGIELVIAYKYSATDEVAQK